MKSSATVHTLHLNSVQNSNLETYFKSQDGPEKPKHELLENSQVGNFKTVRYLLKSKQSLLAWSGSPLRGVCRLKCGSACLLLLCAEHPLQQPQYLDLLLLVRSDCTPIRGWLCTADEQVHQPFVGLKIKKKNKQKNPTPHGYCLTNCFHVRFCSCNAKTCQYMPCEIKWLKLPHYLGI